ncbi:ATP-binding cassette sub-family A member 13 [Diceros bicornis minor]|uniref:ATP-binding cassette sub-family A member 13 n=1 Tax=Diceros bicornis minor TaxID=77932 RepID=UPI0026EFFDD8|nr:ATP-binding cassette sub-family A member 13 [Diceros bicornis minor]
MATLKHRTADDLVQGLHEDVDLSHPKSSPSHLVSSSQARKTFSEAAAEHLSPNVLLVLSLAEFFWPCILFMILTVLRFQEPPRHRDNCYLQPRDLPSRGVFPFVQSLLCNTGSRCRNISYAGSTEHHFRSSRFQTAAGRHKKLNDLAFLKEMQDLAEEINEMMDKAKNLQKLWVERSKTPDSSYGSSFLTVDLNKTEEVISKLESLHQQPHIWNFLLLLPRLYAGNVHVEDGIRGGQHLLQAVLNSLTSLEDLDWLPLNHSVSRVSEIVLNVSISTLALLQEHGVTATESGYNLSLQKLMPDPQKVQADLKSQFGFDDLHAEQIMNYSAELQEMPTHSSLERMVCSVLSHTSEDEADRESHPGDCHPRWSAAKDYLVNAVSWLQVYEQVFDQWRKGSLLQKVLTGTGLSLEALRNQFEEESEPWNVAEALHTTLLLLNDSLADGPRGNQTSPKILLHLQKLQSVLRNLPQWPALKTLLQLDGTLRNAMAQNLHFVQEILLRLETSANDSTLGGPGQWKLEKDMFFWELKQLLMKNATDLCLGGCLSEREALLHPGNSSICKGLWGLMCHHNSSSETSALNNLLGSVKEADHLLQEVITGHTNMPVSIPEGYLGWQELETQLLAVSLSCTRLFGLLGADVSPGNSDFPCDCKDQLVSTVIFHTLEKAQSSLEQTHYWKAFMRFVRKTCEMARHVNMQESFQNSLSAFSEDSPCYEENMDWKIISENYFAFFNNLLKSPVASISRVLNSTKKLLMMEKKLHTLEDEQMDFLLSFVGFLEKLLLPNPFNSFGVPKFDNLPSLTETILNTSHLWINHLKSLERGLSAIDVQKSLEFGKEVSEKIQALGTLWIRKESRNILRFMELILFEINPKLLELWMYGISEGERAKLETLSTLLNFSVPEDEMLLSKSFNFSQLFHSDWPKSPAVKMDFVHLSETVINSLYEFGFLRQEEVSEALDTVYAIRNASHLFSALSESQKQEIDEILTYIYLNVFKDKDSALLLQIYSSFYQHIYKFLSIQTRQSLLSFLTQLSEHILDIIKQFNFQNISKAFAFLYETTRVLEGISDVSYCQQLLSIFNFLEIQAQSLMSTEGPELEVIYATLTGLKRLLIVDGDFRISLFQYISQLFNESVEALLDNECFALDNKNISYVNYSIDGGSLFILPWAQTLSNFSTNGNVFNEFMAVHCTVSWLQMWTEIWGSISQIFKFDVNVFTPLHVGVTQLLDELESDMKISKSCQGVFPTHRPARLILNLFKNVTQADGFHDWDDFLNLRDLWVALGDVLVRVKSLNPDQIEKSLFTMETALHQLKAFPLNTNASREFLYSLFDVFIELSNSSEYIDRNVHLINHLLSNNLTNYGVKFESVITKLRETMLFLRNVSHDQDLLSCADIFQNVTEFILEDSLLYVNTSQRPLRILAMLNSTFSSEDTISRLKRCIAWVDIINRLYMMYNSSFSQGHFQGILKSFKDVENKINSTLKLVTWMLNIKEQHCSLNKSNINCVNINLKNVTDFLNVILTAVFEKEKIPKFEILLTPLNDSTNQIRMIINNLTRDFDFASQSNWKHFTELILRPIEMLDEIPSQFQNIWLHLVALGKEIQKLMKDISANVLENNSSSKTEKLLNIFAISPKAEDVNSLGNSFYHLASYLAFDLSHDLQNSSKITPREITKAVGLGIQLVRDVFNSLMPSVHHDILQDPGNIQVLKKVTSLLHTLKKTDIDLLVGQLQQISESLVDFFKNISRSGTGNLEVNVLVGLMEKFVDSSHSWNGNHLLKLSHLFPKDDVNAVVDAYYALPHAARLLKRLVDKNITEALKDVYNFTFFHGISISNVTKENFAVVIKTLLDTIELISEKPDILSEALTCLPVVWCWNHTASGFQHNPKLAACNAQELMSSSFYSKVASILDHLHLSPPSEVLQCSNESSQTEITRKVVCVVHELVDWNSILLEVSEVFHVKTSLVKTVQEFWNKVLPFVLSSGNQSNDIVSELCPGGPIKQVALQIIKKLKNVNFTKVTSDENIVDKLASLNKILNINEGIEAPVRNNISLNLERIINSLSRDQSLENSTHSLVSPFVTFLNANLTGSSLEMLSSFIKKSETAYNFEERWLEFEQTMKDLTHDFNIRPLFSEVNKEIQIINSVAHQNITLQLAHFLENLGSSSLKALEIIEDLLSVAKNWLHKYANEEYSRMIQTLFLLMANESSIDDVLLTKDIATILDYLKNISRKGNFDVALLTHLLNQEQLTNFSVVQLLFESFLINSINNLAGSSQEAALNLSDTDLQIINFINFTLNHTQSENGKRIILPPRNVVDFMAQLLKTFFFLLKENSEDKISLVLKDLHKDIVAEMSFVPKDKILEILKLDQFLAAMKEDRLMSIFSSLKETVYHLIKSLFILDNGEFYFDNHRRLKFMRDLINTFLGEISVKNKAENNLEFLTVVSQLLFHLNSSEDLFKLNHNLRSALHLVKKASIEIASLMGTLINSPNKDFRTLYPTLKEVILANLTDLLSFINNSFPLRNRATLQITKRLLGVISRAGGESRVPEPVLEMSNTLIMLVSDSAEMRDLATLVNSTVKLLKLAKKVSRTMATIFETHFISKTNDTMKFFDTLYSILHQSVRNVVNEITTLKKVDYLIFENINDLLMPFLDLAFGMIGVKPSNISQDSDIFNMSSSIFSYVNQSKDFSDILEDIAEFLTSVKINLGDLEHLVAAFNNGTQIFSMDSVNSWEEILDCLVPINNITNQIDLLHPDPISTHIFPQDTKWERTNEVILFLDEIILQNSTEIGMYLRIVIDLILESLWNHLEKDDWNVSNLLLTFAQHPNNLLKAIKTVVEVSSGMKSDYGGDLSKALFFNTSLIQNVTHQQLEEAIQIVLTRIALLKKGLLQNKSQWINSIRTLFQPAFEILINATPGKNITSGEEERTKKEMTDLPYILNPSLWFERYVKEVIALTEYWQKVPLTDQSVVETCQVSWQPLKPPEAIAALQKVKMLVLRALIIFAENPSLTKDILCASLSCKQGRIRPLILYALQGVPFVHDYYQEVEKIWSSPHQLNCESLSRNLSSTLESFKSHLENVTERDCDCQPVLDSTRQRMHTLAQSLEKTLLSGNPIMTFLSKFTVTENVKVKDLMKNITKLTEELRSSVHISDETINSILEANISHSKVLWSGLTVALSGRCDQDVLRLLLVFPDDEKSWFATKELCSLPRAKVYSLIVLMSRNLNLRNFIYKTLIPSEASGMLGSLLDVVSRLSHLLPKAGHVLAYLPEFLHTFKFAALLDMPDFQRAPQKRQARSSAFGSFQSVMKMVCKEQASFLSSSSTFINLPRVNELLGDDKEKFNIPEDSTPFCLKLYQEILQSPNGALVWSFLKPILHGKILYTPNTPEINKVIQKANYTFYFVDKLKTLSETLLKMYAIFQSNGNGQMLNQLQESLRNKFIRNFIESQLHIDVDELTEKLQVYGEMLHKMLNHMDAGRIRFLGRVLVNLSSCVALNRFQALESVAILESTAHELLQQNSFLASIIFNSSLVGKNFRSKPSQLPPHITYTIRTSVLYSMRTDSVKNPVWKFHPQSLPADGFKYNYIFVPLQDMIERAIILVQTGQEVVEPAAQVQAIPYPCHTRDLFLNHVGFFFPLIMMLTWMVSVASIVRKLVYEREIQIEEYMRMMGVHPMIHFLAWFLENVAMLAISSAALALILKISGIFAYSNACIVFLFLLDFGVSVIMLSYFLSAFFSQANTAALCTSLVYMISFLPYIVLLVLRNELSVVIQTFLCLLSTTAFGQGVFFITFLEGQEAGIQWNNMYQAPEQATMTFGWVCWMIFFDSGLYFLCGWYLSNLIPGAFGLRKPWYFPFTASYWKNVCSLSQKRQFANSKGSSPHNKEGELEGGVTLVSVTKEYEHHKAAVQDLTLTFHRGQITALLGTNGAGKTTVISLLTGLYPPTSGTIIINGKNLQTDLSTVRRELGVCPQQNVLFDNLTVLEHLLLFASIKAPQWTKKELHQQVHKTLHDVELTQHQHKQTRALSGGMKRKLSIGMAFIGTSRTVVLDEPTSGVDPCSRRSIWDIILKYREGRTVIFTTHHLDEAEALSDCVAILQQGRLRCCGPPFCLKEAYGQGLSLTLTKQPSVLEVDDPKDIARATSLIQTYIPQAFLKDSSGCELSYAIPKDADRACFKGLFQALDQNLHHLHLTGYRISDTTLEEVFLMLLQDSKKHPDTAPGTESEPQFCRPPQHAPGSCAAPASTPPLRGCRLLLTQMAALLVTRLRHARRAWRGTLSGLLLPVLFVALAMGLFMVRPVAVDYPPLKLTPGHYDRAEAYFFSSDSDNMDLAHVLLRKFEDQDLLCAGLNSDLKNSSCWHMDPISHPKVQDSCGCLKCPNGSARAPYLTNRLGHTLLNLSALPLEEYLLAPSEKPRLGGWSFGVRIPDQVQDANSNISQPKTLAKVWYNQKGFHSLPSYLNHLNNLILWRLLPPAVDWRSYGITLYSHPYGGALLNEDKILESIRQCGVALCIVLGFSILSASIGSSVVRDRVTGAKRLQHICGLGYRTYWFTNFLYDMLFHLVSVCLCVTVIVAFQLTAFTFRENLAAAALLLALFGYATLPWMYLMSRIFSSSDVAFISYVSVNFIFGLCTMLMTIMPRLLAIVSKAQNLQNIYDVLKWVFTIFPQFCLGQGLIELCYNQIKYDLTHNFGVDSYVSPFEMNFLGWIFVQLALQGTVLLLWRILLHWDFLQRLRGHSALQGTVTSCKDVDVEKEQLRVLKGRTNGDILVLYNLSKSYQRFFKRTIAVQDISLGIRRGECFGLLGVNGAGKSTTFKMLTGDVPPTSGHAVIRTPTGEDVDLSFAGAAGIRIGYCPQQDALDELLTGWEHLRYYCSLRGIPKWCIPEVAGDLVRRLHLEAHVDKPVATYSGGTKRKLSTALALLGKPDLLLLDEPSSGMDPCSKRYLWKTIMKAVREGCAAVLTSHSMEECEALCTRLAIMVNGSFRCLGSPQHLKNRFGEGYTLKVWLCKETNQHGAISDCLKLYFPGIQFKGQRLNLLEYHVPKGWECLADLFKVLETNKTFLNIKYYSINQTTLEQVFINFATEQQQTPPSTPDPSTDCHQPHHLPI